MRNITKNRKGFKTLYTIDTPFGYQVTITDKDIDTVLKEYDKLYDSYKSFCKYYDYIKDQYNKTENNYKDLKKENERLVNRIKELGEELDRLIGSTAPEIDCKEMFKYCRPLTSLEVAACEIEIAYEEKIKELQKENEELKRSLNYGKRNMKDLKGV